MSQRSTHKLLLLTFNGVLLAAPAIACGPYFPNQLLFNGGAAVAWAPVADFGHEIDRLAPQIPKSRAAAPAADISDSEQATVDVADLRQALAALKIPDGQRLATITRYAVARGAMPKDARDVALVDPSQKTQLPPEFDLYMRGADSFHAEDMEAARAEWQKLLQLPLEQRRFRGVWAQYMIGKSYLSKDNARAVAAFESVRQMVKEGSRDSLGLGSSSLGWEARAEFERKNYGLAIELYLAQHASGDSTAVQSLAIVCEKIFHDNGKDAQLLPRMAADRKCAGVLTAYVLARGGLFRDDPPHGARMLWLTAVEASGVGEVVGADRLAWAAYQSGDMSAAGRWSDKAPADSAVAQWVKAKLLLRAGKLDAAAEALAKAARAFPQNERWADVTGVYFPTEVENHGLSPRDRAAAELGALELSRGQYLDALDHLLNAGWWLDAAYIAERVLTADELIPYVDRHCPQGTHPELRHLLARRLTRIGRWKEARPYYPTELQRQLDAYIAAIRQGNSSKFPAAERADAFWTAATIARAQGMALLGTELAPDSFADDGDFPGSDVFHARQETKDAQLPPTADELERAGKSGPDPYKRFHYRYIAADHAWSAAQLMPDESDLLAFRLCEAGGWLKANDPKAANRFYKALVTRCDSTALGRAAKLKKWFPETKQ